MKKINSAFFWLLAGLLLLFPLGVLVRLTPFPNVNIYPLDLAAGATAVILTLYHIGTKKIPKFKKLFYSILLFNLFALISLFLNLNYLKVEEMLVSAAYLLRFDAYISLLFIGGIGLTIFQKIVLKKIFIFATFLTVIMGFIQLIFYNNLRNLYYLDWDEHLYRLFSSFLDPNFAGIVFSLFVLYLFGRIIKSLKDLKDIISLNTILFAATITALIFTYSRTALISFAVGFSILLIGFRKIKLLLLMLLLLLAAVFLVSDFSIEGLNPVRIASTEARITSMEEALEIFSENYLFGIGFNAYRYAQVKYGFRNSQEILSSNADAGTDNSFLFILSTAGIAGFIFYLNIWFNIYRKIKLKKKKTERLVPISIISALFIGSFFINALFYVHIMFWVFFYLGVFILPNNLKNYSVR